MSFTVKLDERLARAHFGLLRHAGYDADRVYDEGLSGATDERIWDHLCVDGRLFVILDLDFSDVRRYFSVRVTGNWRITLRFEGTDVTHVDLVDYH